jgi:molybdopterin synthase catalytic subunit
MIDIISEPIDPAAVLARVASNGAGAVVLFLGTTREFTAERQTAALDYKCYGEMAREQLTRLETEARKRWPLVGCAIVHRVGRVELGQTSVAVAVSTAHREAAFEAGKWLIDSLKEVVPIWKKENWVDGGSQWVHPGMNVPVDDVNRARGGN